MTLASCYATDPCELQALLGIAVEDPEGAPSIDSVVAAGTRRERACRGLSERAMSLYQKFQIGDDPSIENLEVTLAMMQMLICQPYILLSSFLVAILSPCDARADS